MSVAVSEKDDMTVPALQAQIRDAIYRAKLEHDPTALLLEMQMTILERMERVAAKPFAIPDADLRRLWSFARRESARGTVKLPPWRTLVLGAVAVVGLALASGVAGYTWAGGFSMTCQAEQGGTVCFRWKSPPTTGKASQ